MRLVCVRTSEKIVEALKYGGRRMADSEEEAAGDEGVGDESSTRDLGYDN